MILLQCPVCDEDTVEAKCHAFKVHFFEGVEWDIECEIKRSCDCALDDSQDNDLEVAASERFGEVGNDGPDA